MGAAASAPLRRLRHTLRRGRGDVAMEAVGPETVLLRAQLEQAEDDRNAARIDRNALRRRANVAPVPRGEARPALALALALTPALLTPALSPQTPEEAGVPPAPADAPPRRQEAPAAADSCRSDAIVQNKRNDALVQTALGLYHQAEADKKEMQELLLRCRDRQRGATRGGRRVQRRRRRRRTAKRAQRARRVPAGTE